MNYADQADDLWGKHLWLKAKITDMGRANEKKAWERVKRDIAGKRKLISTDPEILVAQEIQRLNQGDILRANLIEEDKFVRDQHDSLCLRALMHGHKSTRG